MDLLPLSLSQKEVWTEYLAWPQSPHLNLGGLTKIEGPLKEKVFQQALNKVVIENDALRLVPNVAGEQILLSNFEYPLVLKDFSAESNPIDAAKRWQQKWMSKAFHFDGTPPNRFALLAVSENVHFFVIQCLHTVMDGWSTSLIVQKVGAQYSALCNQRPQDEHLDKPYQHFLEESLRYKNSNAFNRAESYWEESLPKLPAPLFAKKYENKVIGGAAQAYLETCSIPRTFFTQLSIFSKQRNVSNFHCFLASLAIYLCKSQNCEEVVIGVPSLNRSGGKYKNTLGMFVGVLPIRVSCNRNQSISDIIIQISKSLSQAYRHAKYPLSEHYKRLDVIKSGAERVFDVLLSYEDFDFTCEYGDASVTETRQTFSGRTRYPLAISIADFEQDVDGEMLLEGSEEFFSEDEILLVGKRILEIGQQLLVDPEKKVSAVSILPYEEKMAQIDRMVVTDTKEPKPYINLFFNNTNLSPNAVALITADEEFSYKQLRCMAFNLAIQLKQKGVVKSNTAAFALERGPETIIAMMACSIIGAIYLPLDPDIPIIRLDYILSSADARILLVNQYNQDRFSSVGFEVQFVELSETTDEIELESVTADDTAYILFTSGSTGQPKGVSVSHGALSHRLNWIREHWQIVSSDRSLQATQINFDPALIEALVPLISGASVAFPPKGRLLPEALPGYISKFNATFMAFVPSTLARFLDGVTKDQALPLRICCCGGETLTAAVAQRFISKTKAQLFNVYGPTEACIFATAWSVNSELGNNKFLPIGTPITNTQIYILDNNQSLLPYGVTGEIYIGGEGLASGYLGNQELTEKSFIAHPLHKDKKLYRTGDLGWLDIQGCLHFSGRNDRQIKLRGYRIELGEIENAIADQDNVKEAAVKLTGEGERAQLKAWISLIGSSDINSIRNTLYHQLPDYMLPSEFYILDDLPLSNNGKVAYDELIELQQEADKATLRAPIGSLEKNLLNIWTKVLKQTELTIFDNFFASGGDSLSAVISLVEAEKLIGRQISLQQLLANPTVSQLAESIEKDSGHPELLVTLGETNRGKNLYIAASGHGDIVRFKALAQAMGGFCDLNMLQPPENKGDLTIKELGVLYAEKIKQRGEKNIYIAGFSIGGLAAIETAIELEANDLEVKELFLVDTVPLKMPKLGIKFWQLLAIFIKRFDWLSHFIFSSKVERAICDKGLLLQVKSMKAHKLVPFSGSVNLLKSKAFGLFRPLIVKRWRRIFGSNLQEYEMETSHSGFFDKGKVEKLAEILKSKII